LNDRGNIDGLVGPVAEFLNLPPDRAAAVEGALGSLLQALVVRDKDAAARMREWVASHSDDGSGSGSGSVTGLGSGSGSGTSSRDAASTTPTPTPHNTPTTHHTTRPSVHGTVALIPQDALPKL